MDDIQGQYDDRGIALDAVGITGLRYPVTFDDGETRRAGIADIEFTVRLQPDRRGTHMSRMVEITHEHLTELNPQQLPIVLKAARSCLDSEAVSIGLTMPFGTLVRPPTGGQETWQVSELGIRGTLNCDALSIETTVTTEVTSVCPCSKAISDYGAHNQRSRVSLTVLGSMDDPYPLPINAAVELLRSIGSAPVYPLVKRPDERLITMTAHDNPVFVEDMARALATLCDERGLHYRIKVRNLESIHSHDAVAEISRA